MNYLHTHTHIQEHPRHQVERMGHFINIFTSRDYKVFTASPHGQEQSKLGLSSPGLGVVGMTQWPCLSLPYLCPVMPPAHLWHVHLQCNTVLAGLSWRSTGTAVGHSRAHEPTLPLAPALWHVQHKSAVQCQVWTDP